MEKKSMLKKLVSMATAVFLMASGISFVGATAANATATNANLSSIETYTGFGNPTAISGFNSNTLSYTIETSRHELKVYANRAIQQATMVTTCNGTVIQREDYCVFTPGTNTHTTEVTATDGTTKKTYTITFNFTPLEGPAVTSTSTITAGQVNPIVVIESNQTSFSLASSELLPTYNGYLVNVGTTGLTRGSSTVSSDRKTLTMAFSGTASAGTLTFQVATAGARLPSNVLSFVVGGGSSSASTPATPTFTPAEVAARAGSIALAAAAARTTAVTNARAALSTALRGSTAATLDNFKAADIAVTTTASLARINVELLKLSPADRADIEKIRAIAAKIEFDEAFFNATARPTASTYASNGVTGITERIVPLMNAKILELPVALRSDIKAIQELVNVESFVDRVANTSTRSTVSTNLLISKGLVSAEYPKKHSILLGLGRYPEGSLNTMAKIEAAMKEQIAIAEAPRLRTAEIRARIAARRG